MPKDLTWAVVEASSPTPMASMAGLGFSPGGGKLSVVMKGIRERKLRVGAVRCAKLLSCGCRPQYAGQHQDILARSAGEEARTY